MTTILQDVDQMTGKAFTDAEIRLAIETANRKATSKLGRTIVLSDGAIPYVDTDAVTLELNEGEALAELAKMILEQGIITNRMREPGSNITETKSLEQLFNESGLVDFLNTPDTGAGNPSMEVSNSRDASVKWRS